MKGKPDRRSGPEKGASPGGPPEDKDKSAERHENSALAYVQHMQKDAVAFYKAAVAETDNAVATDLFRSLQSLHEAVLGNLAARLRDASPPESSGTEPACFTPLTRQLSYGLTRPLAEEVSMAEEKCLHAIEELLGDVTLPQETRGFLAGQLEQLGGACDRTRELLAAARKMETPAA